MYGLLHHESSHQGLFCRTEGQMRPFVLSRSGFLGSWRSAFLWTGDSQATWPHLRCVVPMVLSAAACGQSFIGADVGGFVGTCGAELLLRWQQLGAWLPFYRVHSDKSAARREAFRDWLLLPFVRKAVMDRYRMLPHWYTLCAEYSLFGDPLIRPAWWLDPAAAATETSINSGSSSSNSGAAAAEPQAFLLGTQVYVQPVVNPMTPYEMQQQQRQLEKWGLQKPQQQQQERQHPGNIPLSVPRGFWWYDADTGAICCRGGQPEAGTVSQAPAAAAERATAAAGSSSSCNFPLTLRRIPVFIRGGSVLVTRERPRPSALLAMQEPLTLHVYLSPQGTAEGRLYLDDGTSFKYRDGQFLYLQIRAQLQQQQQQQQRQQLTLSLEPLPLPLGGPEGSWRFGALNLQEIPNACISHVAIWGVQAPPVSVQLTRSNAAAAAAAKPLQFSVCSLPLNPETDPLRVHRREYARAAKEPPPAAAAAAAQAASVAADAEKQQQQQQQLLVESREALAALVGQPTEVQELQQQQLQQQQHLGYKPMYRVLIGTPHVFVTEAGWGMQVLW